MIFSESVKCIPGPILILGASGFVGANLFRKILEVRTDVYAVVGNMPSWRLAGVPEGNVICLDLLVDENVRHLIQQISPKAVFDCAAYGAYSFQADEGLIYKTNFIRIVALTRELMKINGCIYLHAGSSSEYGDNANGPAEDVSLTPNSHYAVSKAAVANLIYFLGKKRNFPCANLRLYSVYGPLEDSSRLIPNLVVKGIEQQFPSFVSPDVSRDFVYVDDVCDAFVTACLSIQPADYGESFNVGSGRMTTISELAAVAKKLFNIPGSPVFSNMEARAWDVTNWVGNPDKIQKRFGWSPKISLVAGLEKTRAWLEEIRDRGAYLGSSKKFTSDDKFSVSAIVACYKDAQAIPIMADRLVATFKKIEVEYEIIFVNDASPDDSENVIKQLSLTNSNISGVTHSRNFGSQAAFRSGMALATKNACVLLDGDLQDPPELIEKFVDMWKQGYEVVYGRRVKRETTLFMGCAYKLFYYLLNKFSYISIPRDAGDFSLIDRRVSEWILRFPERDFFLRGIRAFAGFKQVGVDYVRPERMFGKSTNNFFKNVGWAKKGLFAYSNMPLNALSFAGLVLLSASFLVCVLQILSKIFFPSSAPPGVTTVVLAVIFFGSINLFGISIIGEYLSKVIEEVKRRPAYIRKAIIRDGEVRLPSAETEVV